MRKERRKAREKKEIKQSLPRPGSVMAARMGIAIG